MLAPLQARVSAVACNPKQDIMAAGYSDGTVLMVRLEDGAEILVRRNGDAPVAALAFVTVEAAPEPYVVERARTWSEPGRSCVRYGLRAPCPRSSPSSLPARQSPNVQSCACSWLPHAITLARIRFPPRASSEEVGAGSSIR